MDKSKIKTFIDLKITRELVQTVSPPKSSTRPSHFDSGCRNVSHCQQQHPIQDYVPPDDHTQPTYLELSSVVTTIGNCPPTPPLSQHFALNEK